MMYHDHRATLANIWVVGLGLEALIVGVALLAVLAIAPLPAISAPADAISCRDAAMTAAWMHRSALARMFGPAYFHKKQCFILM